MEEEKKPKNKKSSLYIIVLAVLLIGAGAALILTGNNKSFLGNNGNEPNESNNTNANTDNGNQEVTPPDDDPNKGLVPSTLQEWEVLNLLLEKKNLEYPNESWSIGNVSIKAHDKQNEKFLIEYDEVAADGTLTVLQTIVTVLGDKKYVEFPGWVPGTTDLSVYDFDGYNNQNQTTEPTENPVPEQPVNNGEPQVVEQPNSGEEVVVNEIVPPVENPDLTVPPVEENLPGDEPDTQVNQ